MMYYVCKFPCRGLRAHYRASEGSMVIFVVPMYVFNEGFIMVNQLNSCSKLEIWGYELFFVF